MSRSSPSTTRQLTFRRLRPLQIDAVAAGPHPAAGCLRPGEDRKVEFAVLNVHRGGVHQRLRAVAAIGGEHGLARTQAELLREHVRRIAVAPGEQAHHADGIRVGRGGRPASALARPTASAISATGCMASCRSAAWWANCPAPMSTGVRGSSGISVEATPRLPFEATAAPGPTLGTCHASPSGLITPASN